MCEELNKRNSSLATTAPCDFILIVFAEASNENFQGMVGVGSVIRNRVNDRTHEWKNLGSYEAVIHEGSGRAFNGVGNAQWRAADAYMKGTGQLSGSNLTAFNTAMGVAEGIYNGSINDNTNGSTWFAAGGAFGGAVSKCIDTKSCEKVDLKGDRGLHEFAKYKEK